MLHRMQANPCDSVMAHHALDRYTGQGLCRQCGRCAALCSTKCMLHSMQEQVNPCEHVMARHALYRYTDQVLCWHLWPLCSLVFYQMHDAFYAGASAVLGFIAIVLAFWLPPATPHGFVIFMVIFALGELAIFAGTAPSGAVK